LLFYNSISHLVISQQRDFGSLTKKKSKKKQKTKIRKILTMLAILCQFTKFGFPLLMCQRDFNFAVVKGTK